VVKTYHELFKDKNTKVLLKYDGERMKCLFTIAFYDMLALANENTLCRDTDKPHDVYFEFLSRKGIHNSNCEFFDFFTRSTETLIKALGHDMIFIITMDVGKEANYHVSVSSPSDGAYKQIYSGANLNDFMVFLDTQ